MASKDKSRIELVEDRWAPLLDAKDHGFPEIKDKHRRQCMAVMFDNMVGEMRDPTVLSKPSRLLETSSIVNNIGDDAVKLYDPVLISLVRRSMPNLIAYDTVGVQPLTGPNGLIFAIRSRYHDQANSEALYAGPTAAGGASYDINTGYSSRAEVTNASDWIDHTGYDPTTLSAGTEYTASHGFNTAFSENLGANTDMDIRQMAFTIEKATVTANSRALKAEYTVELAQDLKAIHGLDCEGELSNILAAEILAEMNREIVRSINISAAIGAQQNVTTAGSFDLDLDSNGRWSEERFKGLLYQIHREANHIAKDTRRGRGNFMLCGSDVASALEMTGRLSYAPELSNKLDVDDTGNTFVGILDGKFRVYIDPYFWSSAGQEYATIGYRGASPLDAGIFFCPYVPLQLFRAVGENSFQPKIAYKTRYGLVAHPFATAAADGAITFSKKNYYFRRITIKNLM